MAERLRFVELVEAVHEGLDSAGVGHGFGGAIALAYYVGEPRATRDMDINIAESAPAVTADLPAIDWGELA